MTREEVVAACSLFLPGRIVASEARTGASTFLNFIECGSFGNSVSARFAPPPSEPRVIQVSRTMADHAGDGQFGSPEAFLERARLQYGLPAQAAMEKLQSSDVQHVAWVFSKDPQQISCVVAVPATVGGRELVSGIPAGGPCADHLIARLVVMRGKVSHATMLMLNADTVASTLDAHARSRAATAPAGSTYEMYAKNARDAGLETREQRARRLAAEAALAVGIAAAAASDTSGTGGRPAPSTGTSSTDDQAARRDTCRQRCNASHAPIMTCSGRQDVSSCLATEESALATCLSRCH